MSMHGMSMNRRMKMKIHKEKEYQIFSLNTLAGIRSVLGKDYLYYGYLFEDEEIDFPVIFVFKNGELYAGISTKFYGVVDRYFESFDFIADKALLEVLLHLYEIGFLPDVYLLMLPIKRDFIKDIARKYSTYEDVTIRELVASNPNTPDYVLEQLAEDEEPIVVMEVAANPNTPEYVLRQLADTDNFWVKAYLIYNPSVPKDVLQKFLQDVDEAIIVDTLEAHPELILPNLDRLIRKGSCKVKEFLAKLDFIPEQVSQLAKEDCIEVRIAIARNFNAPEKILGELSKDESSLVRAAVASNPNTPKGVLLQLASDKCNYVRAAVASNPNVTQKILRKLLDFKGEINECDINPTEVNSQVWRAIAENPETPKSILRELVEKYGYWEVVRVVKNNPNVDEELLSFIEKLEFEGLKDAVRIK